MDKKKNLVSGEAVVTATTANEMKNLVVSFNEMMREQIRDDFDTAVITLEDIVEEEGQEDKSIDHFSVDFDFGCDYEDKWKEFALKQVKVEPFVAIEFYRNNRDMFINDDAMEEYVRELAEEFNVDDISSFYKQECKIYKDNPYYGEDVEDEEVD